MSAVSSSSLPVVVLGAGVAGLSAAWEVSRLCPTKKVVVIEASQRAGGRVDSLVTDGFVFDRATHGVRKGSASFSMCDMTRRLGLQEQVIQSAPSNTTNRYIYYHGRMHHVPPPPRQIIKPGIFGRDLISAGIREAIKRWPANQSDVSVHDFAVQRFGQQVADVMIGAVCHGIYAGDAKQLSLQACFPSLYGCHLKGSSVIMTGMKGGLAQPMDNLSSYDPASVEFIKRCQESEQWNFKDGMGVLSQALMTTLDQMDNVELHFNTPCVGLQNAQDAVAVHTEGASSLIASHVISAIPGNVLATALASSHESGQHADELNEAIGYLNGFPRASVAVVNLGYKAKVLPFKGFGYLVPPCENDTILGCIFDSCVYPEQNRDKEYDRLSVMIGGHMMTKVYGSQIPTNEQLIETSLAAVKRQLGITKDPDCVLATMHFGGIPQYGVGHVNHVKRLEEILAQLGHDRLSVIGSSYHGVSVSDCVRLARNIGGKVAAALNEVKV